MSLARRFLVMQLLLVLGITVVFAAVLLERSSRDADQQARRISHIMTMALADDPWVAERAADDDPHAALQPLADELVRDTEVDWITIMSPEGIRWTHPDPQQIGRPFNGSIAEARSGEVHTSTELGRLGLSARTTAPVRDADGEIVALVSSGVLVESTAEQVRAEIPLLLGLALVLFLAASAVAWTLARYLSRATGGRPPSELAEAVAVQDAVLEQAAQGLLLVEDGRLLLANPRARVLLQLPPPPQSAQEPRSLLTRWTGRRRRGEVRLEQLGLPRELLELLLTEQPVHEHWLVLGGRTLIVTTLPASAPSRGMVAIVRDHTELTRLSGQLRATTTMAQALRSQTHEHANRMHTVVSLLELDRAPEARSFASQDLRRVRDLSGDVDSAVADPILAALLVGKTSAAHERGIRLEVTVQDDAPALPLTPAETVTVVGNLLDNAFDAVLSDSPRAPSAAREPEDGAGPLVELELAGVETADGRAAALLTVADNGPGVDPADAQRIFERGVSTKPTALPGGRGVGLALVREIVDRHGGRIEIEQDRGAVFVVTLPLEPGAPAADRREASPDER